MLPKFEARMSADNQTLDLLMYGPIGTDWYGDGSRIDAKAVVTALNANKTAKQINLQINSPGGEVFQAFAMYTALKDHPAKVVGAIDGLCASSMTLIAAACDEIVMSEAGLFMIHEASWGSYGSVADQEATLVATKKMNEITAAAYAARSGQPLADVVSMMAKETWMTAKEAKDKGFVTSTKALKTMSAAAVPGQFANVPDHIKPILAKLQMKEEPTMTMPTPTPAPAVPAAPAAPAVVPPPAAPPVAVVPPAAPPVVPPVFPPVAQPVQMTAAEATMRASQITSACVLAGKPEMASKWIDDPLQTPQSVQSALFATMCAERAPKGESGPGAGTPPPPANPNLKFEAEYDAAGDVYPSMGLSKEQYVKSRRVDEGLDKLSMVPVKKTT